MSSKTLIKRLETSDFGNTFQVIALFIIDVVRTKVLISCANLHLCVYAKLSCSLEADHSRISVLPLLFLNIFLLLCNLLSDHWNTCKGDIMKACQCREFYSCKILKSSPLKTSDIFAQNIDCGYMQESPS